MISAFAYFSFIAMLFCIHSVYGKNWEKKKQTSGLNNYFSNFQPIAIPNLNSTSSVPQLTGKCVRGTFLSRMETTSTCHANETSRKIRGNEWTISLGTRPASPFRIARCGVLVHAISMQERRIACYCLFKPLKLRPGNIDADLRKNRRKRGR